MRIISLSFALSFFCIFTAFALTPEEARDIAVEAYIYGYPLVTMEMTRKVMTNVDSPTASKAPMGQFANMKKYPTVAYQDVTAPNADTLYSVAWINLSEEPYILHVPDEAGRYYLMPVLSAWTNVAADPGTRTTGTKAQDFALTGPRWEGKLPSGVKEIKCPTSLAWIIGRTYCTGTPEDYASVYKIQEKYTLTPLSSYGKPYLPPAGQFDPMLDMKTPVRTQVNAMDASAFFRMLALLMRDNPPAAADAPMVEKMAKIGIEAGKRFEIGRLETAAAQAVMKAPKAAWEKIIAYEEASLERTNGWAFSLKMGTYGTNYLQRALIAAIGLGANLPEDAVYPYTNVDAENNPLNGENRYVLHFDKGEIPPVKGFWSLTLYNAAFYFSPNPLNRYTLSTRNALKYNPDGSLDLYIQNQSPGKLKETNWLPAPAGPFILMLRLYWPDSRVLEGSWQPPAVKKSN